ncbi:MAG: DNA translocase FtsK [Alphaproteobacteria bacterium]|jgi:S-DNA-T family DNA segregation ATPase FtsK/SpoIIIE|nr:DNA translocase FtsK [Alphaproteobacteria bacterium]
MSRLQDFRERTAPRLASFSRRLLAVLWLRISASVTLLAVLYIGFALLGFDAQDASLNTSNNQSPNNWLGGPGALMADLVMQSVGHAAWLILLPVGARAARQLRGVEISHPNWRFLAACAAPLFMALTFAFVGRDASPYDPFHGGAFGQLMGAWVEMLLAAVAYYPGRNMELGLASLAGFIACLLALFASGLTRATGTWGYLAASAVLRLGKLVLRPKLPSRVEIKTDGALEKDTWRVRLIAFTRPLSGPLSSLMARMRLRKVQPAQAAPAPQDYEALEDNDYAPRDEAPLDAGPQSPAVEVTDKKPAPKKGRRATREQQPRLAFEKTSKYQLPPLRLLTEHKPPRQATTLSKDALEANARMLETVLQDFGVRGTIGKVRPGPVVTLYELEPAAGVRSSRVVGLSDDIARSMSAVSARVAPVPGANVIGIELPNQTRELVSLRELLSSHDFENGKSKLTMALGKDIGGAPVMADLTKMPHLLVAGTTGSGKSVGINTMILSLLYRMSPAECRLILVDPKMLELSVYDGIPHLLAPVVTEPKKAVVALKWVVQEMENRYRKMAKVGVRNIEGFNDKMREAQKTGETLSRRVQTGFDPESGEAMFEEEIIEAEVLPFIVVVIDEMADLMMVAGKDIEGAVQRLAQMARAAGVHLITATQRPSVDVITGTIKANFPSRISFQVTSKIDSRTVLGEQGGEQLLGQGDMLFMGGGGRVQRVHGPFVSDDEVEKVVSFLKKQGAPLYLEEVTEEPEELPDLEDSVSDSLYDQAVAIVTRDGRASTSYVQRRLQIGYNKAAGLIEQMEEQGVISPPNGSGKREILVDKH